MSVASSFALPQPASSSVIAIEYGSSPVDAALHHMRIGRPAIGFSVSASAWKWCSSRKNEVRLVVRQLMNSCHSASPAAPLARSRPLR